ncbi:hypothetical protein [Fodinicurvata sediminis]|uniref:hypothetical protein n=1 Tax=Fodinicurvata sediminis TaxID=1121832 RepID=UPI0003B74D4F|nr:hypothetical protein [Fodinicurvata sediminis]
MSIRPANFRDIPAMLEVLRDSHARSIYEGRAALNEKESKALFVRSIQRHGNKSAGGTIVYVSEKVDGLVHGFMIGHLSRLYHVLDGLMATDLFLLMKQSGDPRDASRLLDALIEWGEANPKVVEVKLGITNAVGDFRRTERLYRRKGLAQSGMMFERRVR